MFDILFFYVEFGTIFEEIVEGGAAPVKQFLNNFFVFFSSEWDLKVYLPFDFFDCDFDFCQLWVS